MTGHSSNIDCVNATVPLWALVALGLAAPTVALVGVLITTRAESRRSHRNWLRQTKYESYEDLFSTYLAMKAAYSDYLDAEAVTNEAIERLSITADAFKRQFDKTKLIAGLRVSFYPGFASPSTWRWNFSRRG